MAQRILIVAEQRLGILNPQSIETVVAGQRLAGEINAELVIALIGNDLAGAAGELATADAARLLIVENELLETYNPDGFCVAVRELVTELQPQWVMFPQTYQARDFAPCVAAGFKRSVLSDCTSFRHENGNVVFVRELFQGKTSSDVVTVGEPPHFVSIQASAFPAADLAQRADKLTAEPVATAVAADQIRGRSESPAQGPARDVDLTEADIIVSVGRGIGGPEHIDIARDLAKAIGGELGASRPVCDAEWLPNERQVGSSGQTVSPKLYVALGISGASQHLVGMRGSQTIVAINKDPKAPIFKEADYGIVGDLMEVVPELTKAL